MLSGSSFWTIRWSRDHELNAGAMGTTRLRLAAFQKISHPINRKHVFRAHNPLDAARISRNHSAVRWSPLTLFGAYQHPLLS